MDSCFRRNDGVIALLAAALFTLPAFAQDMATIPAGPFTMGGDDGPADERPAHTVRLAAFDIDKLPVTNAQFTRFLDAHGAIAPDGRRYYDWDDGDARIHQRAGRWVADAGYEDHPAVEVSWWGAVAYCRWQGKRLPTEAEWEKAARGTVSRIYPWGNESPTPSHARFASGYNDTAPAAAFPAGATAQGVLGMAGNVWQWVSSAYRPYPYSATDGREDLAADAVRGTRGGGHDSTAAQLRVTERGSRVSRAPRAGHHNIGLRCAK